MKILKLSLLLVALAGAARAEMRMWTSADDASKKFEGEFISSNKDSVAIKRKDGKQIVLPLTKVSEADREFISRQGEEKAKQGEEKASAEKAKEAGAKLKESEMAKALSGKTVTLEGKSLKKHDIFAGKAPEYYLVYWGASWCGPCRQAAPKLAELYDAKVASATNVEFVHVSCDLDEAKMKEFMKDMKFKFPAVPMTKAGKIKILDDMKPSSIPTYKLLDSAGKVIAQGDEAKHKAEELAAATAKSTSSN